MSGLHLLRLPVIAPRLLRFAAEQGITQEDADLGYTLHAWLTALFGKAAPKPFRYFERRGEMLAYANSDAATLLTQAQAFAPPQAWAVLEPEGVASKPMPQTWRVGQRLRIEALVCPVARRDDQEKDVYLRTLDRLSEGVVAPSRAEVYQQWFVRQLGEAVQVEALDLLGMSAQIPMLRRDRSAVNSRLRIVKRPRALIAADIRIADPERFVRLLARGVGRHRTFGYGMLLLAPPQ